MKTYHFNTGVRPFDHSPPAGMAFMSGFKDSGNGVYVIPFDCDEVPAGYRPVIACNHLSIPGTDGMIVREIYNSRLLSRYVYFKLETV